MVLVTLLFILSVCSITCSTNFSTLNRCIEEFSTDNSSSMGIKKQTYFLLSSLIFPLYSEYLLAQKGCLEGYLLQLCSKEE